jgi:hypothetical protein
VVLLAPRSEKASHFSATHIIAFVEIGAGGPNMFFSLERIALLIAALLFLSSSAASACMDGDKICHEGIKYLCKCWTEQCEFYPYGTCHHNDLPSPLASNFIPLKNKSLQLVRLECGGPRAARTIDLCSQP